MKNFKLIAVITVLSLVFGAMVGISSFATDAEAAVKVDKANLCYNELMHIAVTLECTEELADGETLGLLVWDDTVEGELTAENATHTSFTEKQDKNQVKYFASQGIPAPKMGDVFKLAGCIKDAEGNIRIGTVSDYSVVEYLNDRLADSTATSVQIDLYNKTLAYGKAAGAVFAD